MVKPGLYVKGKRQRVCVGQKGVFVYYKVFSNPKQTTGVRLDIWEKWAKDAEYLGCGKEADNT